MIELNGNHMYVFQTAEDARDACVALKDGHRVVDTNTVLSKCRPNEAEARLRTATVMVSGIDKHGNLTGTPHPKTIDLWVNLKVVRGPDGIDIDLDRRIRVAIEDAEMERTKGKVSK